jgi:hypothetical protein
VTAQDGLAAGTQTTRLTAEEKAVAHRAGQRNDALTFLTRAGHDDIAVILGLAPLICPTCRVEPVPPGREHCEQGKACRDAERALRAERRETADA